MCRLTESHSWRLGMTGHSGVIFVLHRGYCGVAVVTPYHADLILVCEHTRIHNMCTVANRELILVTKQQRTVGSMMHTA